MSTTTYQLQSEYCYPSPCSQKSTIFICDTKEEKDIIIFQLKARIFELEQHEKNY